MYMLNFAVRTVPTSWETTAVLPPRSHVRTCTTQMKALFYSNQTLQQNCCILNIFPTAQTRTPRKTTNQCRDHNMKWIDFTMNTEGHTGQTNFKLQTSNFKLQEVRQKFWRTRKKVLTVLQRTEQDVRMLMHATCTSPAAESPPNIPTGEY